MFRAVARVVIRTEGFNADFNLRASRTRALHLGTCGSSPVESTNAIAVSIHAARLLQPAVSNLRAGFAAPLLARPDPSGDDDRTRSSVTSKLHDAPCR
jgi:hypothetical protein